MEVLQSSRTKNITCYDCMLQRNTAVKNTVSLMYANVAFNNSQFYRNRAL